MLLSGKVVLVTGGGHGIGACIARVVGRHGAAVGVNFSTNGDKAASVVGDIRAAGGTAEAFGADIRDPEAVAAMMQAVTGTFGRLDGLVHNAIAGRQHGKLDEVSLRDYDDMLDFGCRATVNLVKAARPFMKAQGGGRVVTIVTELWNMAPAEWSTYLAGKGALVGISRSLACELGPENITVNMVAPGWMADEKVDTQSAGSIAFGKSLPLGRHGSADEIGNACVFFLSELAGYVTGAYLPVTGGRITQMGA